MGDPQFNQIWFNILVFTPQLCISQFQQCLWSYPPGQPRGICSRCQFRQWGIRNFFASQGMGICVLWGDPQTFYTRVFQSAMEEFIGKDDAFVEDWLVRQGLDNLVDVFKVYILSFRYFFITCKRINIKSNNLNYILFITYWEMGNNQLEHDYSSIRHFAFKTSLAFFKFMKVYLECTLK